jgi:hypothetical protein
MPVYLDLAAEVGADLRGGEVLGGGGVGAFWGAEAGTPAGACRGSNSRRGMHGITKLKEMKTNSPTSRHPPLPTPHRRAGLRPPMQRHPHRHAHGFSIESPRTCHHAGWLNMACPSGDSFTLKHLPTCRHPPTPPALLARTLRARFRVWTGPSVSAALLPLGVF